MRHPLAAILDASDPSLYDVRSSAAGPQGNLPLTGEMLRARPSGDLFGWSQNAGMGWRPEAMGGPEFLILSTHGGLRAPDGSPVALGYHTGHWEVGLLVDAAAREFQSLGAIPFAGYCTDPCDGRSQGTAAMFDSLPFRNDAAAVFGRLIRSLPTRKGVMGVATCDKGLPAMMMALAAIGGLPGILVPGGVTLPGGAWRGCRHCAVRGSPLRARPDHFGRGRRQSMPRLRHPRRRLPVHGHRGHLAGSGGKPWACRWRTPRCPPPASLSGPIWRAVRHVRWQPWRSAASACGIF